MVAIYKKPADTLREWAHPYRATHPDFVQGLEDVADSVEVLEAKVAEAESFDFDEVKKAAAALSCPGIDDTLGKTLWTDEHTKHAKELVELADAFDAMAVELGEPAYATHDPAERRKLMILAARRARVFGDLLDVVLVGEDSREPDFKGYDKAIRDWEPKSAAWAEWAKAFVAGVVDYREGCERRRMAGLVATQNDAMQLENNRLKDEVIALRAELDTLKATPTGHNADLQDQAITASTRANQYAYTIEQMRAVITEHDKKRGA